MSMKNVSERLEVERELEESRRKLSGSELFGVERELQLVVHQQLMARKLDLEGAPADAGPSEADVEAGCARSALWREADVQYRTKRRDLESELSRTNPQLDPTRHAALSRELQELKPPDPNAPAARQPGEA